MIFAPKQFEAVGGSLWNKYKNPAALTGLDRQTWESALDIAKGVLTGAIPDRTGGALFFHSGPEANPAAFGRSLAGRLVHTISIKEGPKGTDANRLHFFRLR